MICLCVCVCVRVWVLFLNGSLSCLELIQFLESFNVYLLHIWKKIAHYLKKYSISFFISGTIIFHMLDHFFRLYSLLYGLIISNIVFLIWTLIWFLFIFLPSSLCLRASLVAQWWRICMQYWRPRFSPWVVMILWRREWQPTPVFLPGESPCTEEPGRLQSIGLQRVRHDWATKCTFCLSFLLNVYAFTIAIVTFLSSSSIVSII